MGVGGEVLTPAKSKGSGRMGGRQRETEGKEGMKEEE
jgi:hypothetical protein